MLVAALAEDERSSQMSCKPVVLVYAEAMEMGGVSVAFCELARELERRGYAVKALIPYESDIPIVRIPKRYICGTVWRRRVRNRWIKRCLNAFNVFTRWKVYFWLTPKIEHDIFVNYLAYCNSYWCFYSNKPKIGFFHNATTARHGGFNERIWTYFIRREYESYDCLAAVSDFLADAWKNKYGFSRRPTILHNLVDVDSILEKGNEQAALVCREGVMRLLFVGRLAEIKGVDRLMRVVFRLKEQGLEFDLCIVGDGPKRLWMESYTGEHDLSDRVHFLGMKENPYPYMRASDLLVCSSYSEGWPMIFKEALLMRCPVLTTDFGNAKSRLKDGTWGVVVENTEEALYNGLRRFLLGEISCAPTCGYDSVEREIRADDSLNRNRVAEVFGKLKNEVGQ